MAASRRAWPREDRQLCGQLSGAVSALAVFVMGVLIGCRAWGETLTLDDCVQRALARAPAAQAARFEADGARALVDAAWAAYVPRLLAQGEYGRSEGFDEVVTNGGSTATLLTVEATLLDAGTRGAQLAAARARLHAAAAIEQQRRADVTLAVRAAYFAVLGADAESAIARGQVESLQAYRVVVQQQEDRGLVPHNDVLRVQLALEAARTAQRAARAQLAAARVELETLIGSTTHWTDLAEPAAMQPVDVTAAATDALIDASPVMVDARAAVEAAQRDADAERAARWGALTLTASGGALGVEPGPTFHDHAGGQFLVGASVPVFDGGAIAARVAAAEATAHAAEATAEQTRRTLKLALARADIAAQQAQADLATWQRVVPQAADDFTVLRARYVGGGNVRLLEVLDALTQSVSARLNVPRAHLTLRVAVATQQQLLGETGP